MEKHAPQHIPQTPWVASQQYNMRFILSADNEIIWRCDWMPMEMLQAMVAAANAEALKK